MFDRHFVWPAWMQRLRPPSMCHICEAWPSSAFCESCVQQFGQPIARCNTCAMPAIGNRCMPCHNAPSPLDRCLTAVTYGHPWSECIAKLKFHGDVGLARPLAQLLRNAPWVEPALEKADRVIPIPLSASRLRERGFNQAYELGKHLAPTKADARSLWRLEHASHQVGATRAERLAQARNTFWINPTRIPALHGTRVVLLDDVMTTGATMFEAARTLRKAGVTHITGLVLARAQLADS
jgi:ComF family protein